jgi:CubicO group peptidase (beta-lactamase class C family)
MMSIGRAAAVIWLAAAVPASAQAPSVNVREAAPVEASAPARRGGPRLQPGKPILPSELEAFVDAAVRIGMDEANVAGVAVSIVQDGRIVLNKGYGFASLDPVRPVDPDTTLFRIGSITKTFTWIALGRSRRAC